MFIGRLWLQVSYFRGRISPSAEPLSSSSQGAAFASLLSALVHHNLCSIAAIAHLNLSGSLARAAACLPAFPC